MLALWLPVGFLPFTLQPQLLGKFLVACFGAVTSLGAIMHLILDSAESQASMLLATLELPAQLHLFSCFNPFQNDVA